MNSLKMQSLGFVVLRLGLAFVFAWFGAQQLLHAEAWVSYVPDWAHVSFLTVTQFVMINGLFEVVAAVLLVLNIFTRLVALLLAVHLVPIAISLGITPVGVRDIGLCLATFALFLLGPRRI